MGVLWASASQRVSVKELRAAVGLSRERLEGLAILAYRQPIARSGIELIRAPQATAPSAISSSAG